MSSWKSDCFYHDIIRDMGATVDMCSLTIEDKNFNYKGCLNCNRYLKRDLVQVTRCKYCLSFDSGYCTVNGIFRNEEDYCSRAMKKSV